MMRKITIETQDKVELGATLLESKDESHDLVIIGPAMGVPQNYYRPFAKYIAEERGVNALIFDYRGVGDSLNTDVTECEANLSDWGYKDLKAVIDWGWDAGYNLYLVGHSITGQLLPFTGAAAKLSAAYFVGSQTASHHFWAGRYRLAVLLFWNFLLPVLTTLYGYFPGWGLGGKISLPKGVASEWRSWALHKDGAIQGLRQVQDMYSRITNHIHFLHIADDNLMAPRLATEQLMRRYFGAKATFESVYPEDIKARKIGHFGFFRREFKASLWTKPLDYFRVIAC